MSKEAVVKTPLLRHAALVALLLVAGVAHAQGGGRHGAGRNTPAAAPAGLGYGAGYHARRLQRAARDEQQARQADSKAGNECMPAASPGREPEAARTKDSGPNPTPARRDACAAARP